MNKLLKNLITKRLKYILLFIFLSTIVFYSLYLVTGKSILGSTSKTSLNKNSVISSNISTSNKKSNRLLTKKSLPNIIPPTVNKPTASSYQKPLNNNVSSAPSGTQTPSQQSLSQQEQNQLNALKQQHQSQINSINQQMQTQENTLKQQTQNEVNSINQQNQTTQNNFNNSMNQIKQQEQQQANAIQQKQQVVTACTQNIQNLSSIIVNSINQIASEYNGSSFNSTEYVNSLVSGVTPSCSSSNPPVITYSSVSSCVAIVSSEANATAGNAAASADTRGISGPFAQAQAFAAAQGIFPSYAKCL